MDNFTKLITTNRLFSNGQKLKNLRFKLAFLLLTFTMIMNVNAQVNIAPTATATASTCNTGACSTLNDNALGSCGTQSMWITSSATNPGSTIFIQFTWSSQQRMNKITIHAGESGTRFLGGGTIQIWNGSAWVNHSTFTQSIGVCNYDINFPAISTTQLRIVDIVVIGSQSSNVNFREIQIWSAPSGTNDAGVSSIDSPYAYCSAGNYDVKATIRNFGVNQISGVTVNWSVGGTLQTPITYTTLLDTAGGSGASAAQVTLGTYSFPSTAVVIKAWTSLPNSTIDTSRGNDTSIVTKAPSMGGIYTIDPSGSGSTNFTTFAAAIAALNANGVCGPVIFNVAPATYTVTTPISIGNINGTNAINTITFEGTSAVNRIITGSIASSAVFILNAAKYVTLRNLTISNTNAAPAGLCVTGAHKFININNCRITVPIMTGTSTTGYALSVTGTASGYGVSAQSGDSITIDSNIITGGGYGLVVYGSSNANANRGFLIRNNTINSANYMGCYIAYNWNPIKFLNNTVTMNNSYSTYGVYYYSNQSSNSAISHDFIGNTISNFSSYGIYAYLTHGTTNAPFKCYNNIVNNGTNAYTTGYYGIYNYSSGVTEFYHNTVRMNFAGTSTTYSGMYYGGTTATTTIKNNIFSVAAGSLTPLYLNVNPTGNSVNYNVYHNGSSGTSLVYRGGVFYNASNYKTATAGGDTSYNEVPSFLSVTDLHLKDGCGPKGFDLTSIVSDDIDKQTRAVPPQVGADEVSSLNNDMSVTALLSPIFPISAGTNVVSARIRNTGANAVTSFDLSYTVNGGTAVTQSWFGTLNACDTVSVAFSTPFTVVGGTIYNLKVYSSNPNFSLDANRANDTVTSQVVTPMNGTYTIGAVASDFTTFNAAVTALTSRGVDGPVLFNVKSGVYNESVNLIQAPGMSAINTVKFTSLANNKDSVRLAWNTATGNSYVLQFSGNFFNVNAITIQSIATSGTAVYGVNIGTNASYDTLSNCAVRLPYYYVNSFTSTSYTVYANSVSGVGMSYLNNTFTGSYYGVYYYGNSSNRPKYTYWKGNTFDSSYYAPFYYNYYGNYSTYDGNTFRSRPTVSTTTNYMYWYYQDSAYTFTNNVCDFGTGISTYWYNYYKANTPTARGLVANNAINALGLLYMYFGNSVTSNLDFYNNSFNMGTGYFYLANSGLTSINIRNNIFSGTGAYPFYLTAAPSASIISSDYNNYFTTGSTTPIYAAAAFALNGYRTSYPLFDRNSVSYRAAYTSTTNLAPNANDTAIWILNGRGDYLSRVTTDINGNPRPTTIADGAPDLGAYNVNPAATTLAPRAVATPATPTAGTTQVFTFGFDTVASITWDAFTTPPASVQVRQYSGKVPLLIGSVTNFPYFYTSISAPTGTYLYDAKINYRDNWMGTMYSTFGFTEDLMRLANKEVGVAWNTNSGGLVDTTNNNLTYSGFNNVTQMFTGSDIYNPLPVKLTSFNGSLLNNDAKLTWTTASEINANMFVVERSIDGKNFTAITNVKAAGNKSSLTSYNHLDKGIITLLNSAGTIYYRLKMVDNDNSFSYSKTIEIKTAENTKEKVTVTPNPFTTDLTITVETVNNANGTVEVSDINGRTFISQNIDVVKGNSTITVNGVDKLKQGIYFVRYTTESNTQVFKMLKN